MNKPRLSFLIYIETALEFALETNQHSFLSFEEIHDCLLKGTLLETLEKLTPNFVNFSLYPKDSKQTLYLHQTLIVVAQESQIENIEYNEVDYSGLHLLKAYVTEAIKKQYWVDHSF